MSSAGILQHVFEGLVRISWLTGEPEPALARSWETSPDGLTWTFRLREDAKWHDGEPFTAGDVVFTFDQIVQNDFVSAKDRALFEFRTQDGTPPQQRKGMTVTALDDHTVEFALPALFAPFLHTMSTPIYPEHISLPAQPTKTSSQRHGTPTPRHRRS